MNDNIDNEIAEIYYDIKRGNFKLENTYEYLDKKYTKKRIKEAIKRFETAQIATTKINKGDYIPILLPPHSYQLDLTFYKGKRANSGYDIILTIINANTKKAFAYPLKNKSFESVEPAFHKFLDDCKDKVELVETDAGSEFINRAFKAMMKNNNIELMTVNKQENKNGLAIVERFNRTLRDMITRYLTAYKTKRWVDILKDLINNYNNTKHSIIKMKPNEVNGEKENEIYVNKGIKYDEIKKKVKENIKEDDKVRVLKERGEFKKGAKHKYSKQIYDVVGYNKNKIIISGDGKNREEEPYKLKKIENIIKNPYLDKKLEDILREKEERKEEKKQERANKKLKKEDIDIHNKVIYPERLRTRVREVKYKE